MKILMIGGTRFIGAHVARHLHAVGAEVIVFHRGISTNPILPEVEHVLDPSAAYPVLAFPDRLRRDWDVVIHMVAMGQADAAAAVRMFEGRARRFVMISSCDVYRAYGRLTKAEPGPPDPAPLTEEAPLRSILYPYREMEEQLGAFARDYEKTLAEDAVRNGRDFDWTILRLLKVYGPEDNGDLSSVYGFSAVPDWRWTHGHVDNIAAAIGGCVAHPAARNEVFNLGEEETPTMGERLARLPRLADGRPEPPPFDYRQPLVVETTKIRRCIGYADVVDERSAMHELAVDAAPGATRAT